MTYLAGMRFGLISDTEPTLRCDGCASEMIVRPTRGGMPAWLRDGKAPKGWKAFKADEDTPRRHHCPVCVEEGVPW